MADVTVPQGLALNPGSILVLDRGYQDYAMFCKWTGQGVSFVTRLKANAIFKVLANRPGPKAQNVLPIEPYSSPCQPDRLSLPPASPGGLRVYPTGPAPTSGPSSFLAG
ncbi:hypothetical protein DFAR_3990005 [Desulfarculales bacterium]